MNADRRSRWNDAAKVMDETELLAFWAFWRFRSKLKFEGEMPYEIKLTLEAEIGKRGLNEHARVMIKRFPTQDGAFEHYFQSINDHWLGTETERVEAWQREQQQETQA